MSPAEVVVVGRFEKPPEFTLPDGRPEHEIPHGFSGDGVRGHSVLSGMNPLRANAEHELYFLGERPWLLEEKVHIPFRGVTGEKRRNTAFNFEPVFYRGNFNCEVRSETRTAAFQALARGSTDFDDGDLLSGLGRLRRSGSSAQK